MSVNSDLQKLIPTSSGEIERLFPNSLFTEASNVLQATKNIVADSSDMPSPPSTQSENSNINEETTSRQNNLVQSSRDDRTSTEVPRRPQLDQQAVKTKLPTPSKSDHASLFASGSEACVQVKTANGTSVPLKANTGTTNTSPIDQETRQQGETYRREPNIWLGHADKQPQCAFTVVKHKYTFSSMLIYMIMTTLFTRIYFLNENISNLTTCSSYQELLSLNGACLFILFISLIVQLILDSFNVHTRSSCIVIIGMFTAHFMLLLLMFGRISYCQDSILDYILPTLTLLSCIGYATVAILTVPKLLQ